MTRQQLIDKWNERSKQYERMAQSADLADDQSERKDSVDASTHYSLVSDTFKMCATELSHLHE